MKIFKWLDDIGMMLFRKFVEKGLKRKYMKAILTEQKQELEKYSYYELCEIYYFMPKINYENWLDE